MKKAVAFPLLAVIAVAFVADTGAAQEKPLVDKTLIVWASPASLAQRGGTALTLDANRGDNFDGVVFGELEPKVWMPGSNGYQRTEKRQADWPKETAAPGQFVQMAIVYQGQQITVYRNGEPYARYTTTGQPYPFGPQSVVMFGPRHLRHRKRPE